MEMYLKAASLEVIEAYPNKHLRNNQRFLGNENGKWKRQTETETGNGNRKREPERETGNGNRKPQRIPENNPNFKLKVFEIFKIFSLENSSK